MPPNWSAKFSSSEILSQKMFSFLLNFYKTYTIYIRLKTTPFYLHPRTFSYHSSLTIILCQLCFTWNPRDVYIPWLLPLRQTSCFSHLSSKKSSVPSIYSGQFTCILAILFLFTIWLIDREWPKSNLNKKLLVLAEISVAHYQDGCQTLACSQHALTGNGVSCMITEGM